MSEPIKHHFIPQFILRNFTYDKDKLYYWNIDSSKIEIRNTKSVYMVENLYRDEQNHPTDPTIIEKKFAKFESTIAILFKEKIIGKDSIILTRDENEKLRKFLYLLSFRSSSRKKQYIDANFNELTKMHLSQYVNNEDYVDLWLREIMMILENEEYANIQGNKEISWTIRQDFVSHLRDYYMTFITPRGQDFLFCDIYPTAEIYPIIPDEANLYPHLIFPICPDLLLLLNHIAFKPEISPKNSDIISMVKNSRIKGNSITPPKPNYKIKGAFDKEDTYTYKINKIYSNDVEYINMLMLNEAKKGFSFRDVNRIKESINRYEIMGKMKKNDYSKVLVNIAEKK